MKIRPAHYAHIRDAIRALKPDLAAARKALHQQGRAHDIEKCLRWNLSYAANLSQYICDNIYSYCDDDHIDTALRSIVREIDAEQNLTTN